MLWGWFTYYFTKEGPGYRVVKWCSQSLQLGSGKAKAHPQFSIRTPFFLVMLCWLLLLHNCCKMSFTAWVFGALIGWSILRRKGRGSFQEGLPEILRKDGIWGRKLAWLRSPRKHLFPFGHEHHPDTSRSGCHGTNGQGPQHEALFFSWWASQGQLGGTHISTHKPEEPLWGWL